MTGDLIILASIFAVCLGVASGLMYAWKTAVLLYQARRLRQQQWEMIIEMRAMRSAFYETGFYPPWHEGPPKWFGGKTLNPRGPRQWSLWRSVLEEAIDQKHYRSRFTKAQLESIMARVEAAVAAECMPGMARAMAIFAEAVYAEEQAEIDHNLAGEDNEWQRHRGLNGQSQTGNGVSRP